MSQLPLSQTGLTTKASRIPQSMPVSENQVKNNAGGFVFEITPEQQLDRFLILGSSGGTFYVGKNKLTKDNLQNVINLIKSGNGEYAVTRATEFSVSGRAFNNDNPLAVLAVAAAFGTPKVKGLVGENLNKVARIGTHILHFTEFSNSLRGWGRSLKRNVANWYLSKTPDQVGFQAGVKYRQRDGWSHRDVLRMCHPKSKDKAMNDVFNYLVKGKLTPGLQVPTVVTARELLHSNPTPASAIKYINEYGLPREAIPTELLNDVNVWRALFKDMPLGATIRNLNKMTSLGILKPLGAETLEVCKRLKDINELKRARIHPMQLLFAVRTYQQGKGEKGSLTWSPVREIVAALEEAFYLSFDAVEPSGKRFLLGVDISGSMSSSIIANSPVSAKEAAMVMALVLTKTEPRTYAVAFDTDRNGKRDAHGAFYTNYNDRSVVPLSIDVNTRLSEVENIGGRWYGGGTDCALPMLHAVEKNLEVDTFVVITDNETWHGKVHPHIALQQYRQKTGIPARLVVIGMTSTNFSIANPNDKGMLDVVGFDPATPDTISSFARGDF